MTEQEKKEILDELETRITKKYKGCLYREGTQTVLKEPREKWFKDDGRFGSASTMSEAFGSSIISWQVWEMIRKLTCVVCGKQYVRHLAGIDNADEVAEKFASLFMTLRWLKKKGENNEQNKFQPIHFRAHSHEVREVRWQQRKEKEDKEREVGVTVW